MSFCVLETCWNAACRNLEEACTNIWNKYFNISQIALVNWPIPLFVVGLSQHFRDAQSWLESVSRIRVRFVRSQLVHIQLNHVKNIQSAIQRHFSHKMSERFEVNSVKYYSILFVFLICLISGKGGESWNKHGGNCLIFLRRNKMTM